MAEQIEPREERHYREQPPSINSQTRRDRVAEEATAPAQHLVAPSESFGAFGPLPGYPAEAAVDAQVRPPAIGADLSRMVTGKLSPPQQPVAAPYAAPLPTDPLHASGQPYNTPGIAAALPLSTDPLHTSGQPYNNTPGTPYNIQPARPAAVKRRKPIRFPLIRKAPALLQIFGILLYSLVLVICIMGCLLLLLRAYIDNGNVYFNVNGSTDGLSVVITCVLLLVLAPACSLFCGVFFGSWRGLLAALLALGGGLLMSHLTDPRIFNIDAGLQIYLLIASLPFTAFIVGLLYDRRQYAAWWKSMLTILLGLIVPVVGLLTFIYTQAAANADVAASLGHTTTQNFLAILTVGFACISLLAIPLLSLLYAGIEGIIHSLLARERRIR